jgi:aspartyl-tRNA(Asn)/glutamyl-tRNA(Gln) amidotransferase subunit B
LTLDQYEVVIGLEVHAELLTESKMYCRCANQPGAAPNSNVCPVCLALPGALPVINQRAVELTALTGLALNCSISELSRFDRKNYFYPDLPKGFQISQYQHPIARSGWLQVDLAGEPRRIGIRRVHLEEDTAKLAHRVDPNTGQTQSLVDMNRSGVPLIEIVSEPDLCDAEQSRQYLIALRSILQYLGASTGNMEEGSFRCDANLSVRPVGTTELGTKVEVKNMNSFRAVYRALAFEADRQVAAIGRGERIRQETRGWDENRGITVGQRSKEFAEDYRYFPEPDLPPLSLQASWVAEIRGRLPELPAQRRERFIAQYELSPYDAAQLTVSRSTADYYEQAVHGLAKPKVVANWLTGELFRLLNQTGQTIEQTRLTPPLLVELLGLIESGAVSSRAAKDVFEEVFRTGTPPAQVVESLGLNQISDNSTLEQLVDAAIQANPKSVADYIAGKPQALGFLVGQVMKASKGKANPAVVNAILRARLPISE